MTASRMQHMISSGALLVVTGLIGWISFTEQPAEAFLFPRLISLFFIALSVWNFGRALAGWSKVGEGLNLSAFTRLLPGLVVMLLYVFFAAKIFGFYLSSTVTFLIIYTLYDATSLSDYRAWVKRAFVTACFMAVIYGLFALLLKVQTPKGIMF